MKSTYELALLYHPDLELDLDKVNDKIEKLVADSGAKIKGQDVWGKRRLAYPIGGSDKAIYVFYTLELDGQQGASKLEASLNICDEVIRYLLTKLDLKAIELAKQLKAQKQADKADPESEQEQDNKADTIKSTLKKEV